MFAKGFWSGPESARIGFTQVARSAPKLLGLIRFHCAIALMAGLVAASCLTSASGVPADRVTGNLVKSVTRADGTITVSGDDTVDAYRGTGGLLLPTSYSGDGSAKKTIAECLSCIWRYTIYCEQGMDGFCAHAVATCPRGDIRYRVWFGKSSESTKVVGTVCWGAGKPATRRDFETEINTSALRYVPSLNPGVAPRGSTYTSVPIVAWSGQPANFNARPMYLAGHQVQIQASAMWQWIWGDGSSQWTSTPGIKFPRHTLSHQYRKAGLYRVRVRTVWRATYFVPGIGSFSATGDVISQSAQLPIQVKSAKAVLVAK